MKKFWGLVMIALLWGCFSSPNSRFYLLESTSGQGVVSSRKMSVAVADVQVPDYLQKPQIVLQKQNSPQLKIAEFDRWASDLGWMLQNTLMEDLQKAFPNAEVQPLLYGRTPQYIVKINIEKMSGWLGEEAVLSGSWQIVNGRNVVLAAQDFSLTQKAGKTYAAYVQAQSEMWAEVAAQIGERIKRFGVR